jgi:hypothetical protein
MKKNISLVGKMEKKAVSLMLSYVLLIVIAISLAIGVYVWLKFVAGGQNPLDECPDSVFLIVQSYECLGNDEIQIEVKNQGRFNISGYAIKGTENKSQESYFKLKDIGPFEEEVLGMYLFPDSVPLAPSIIDAHNFSYEDIPSGELKKIELNPFRVHGENKKEIVFCDKSVITQEVDCP